jgi:hypothetical protein
MLFLHGGGALLEQDCLAASFTDWCVLARSYPQPENCWLHNIRLAFRAESVFVLPVFFLPVVTPWLDMAIAIFPVIVIANGVVPPIGMASFPSMETIQPEGFTEQPDIAGSQIVILVADEADVLVTIPDVAVGDHYGSRLYIDRGRGHNHQWLKCHPSIRFNDAA